MKLFLFCTLIYSSIFTGGVLAEQEFKTQLEKEAEIIKFDALKEVIKNDMLEQEVNKKQATVVKLKNAKKKQDVSKYNYPNEEDFWPFLSELWLVKNAPLLKWDSERPDYGLQESFKSLLEELGLYERKFRILLLDSTQLPHTVLPSRDNEYILLVSVPFIRTMDLSKLEISLLLLEDMFRGDMEIFKKAVMKEDLKKVIGKNFYGKKVDIAPIEQTLKRYSDFIMSTGHSFQDQFAITKKMSDLLKGNVTYWSGYYNLLTKIDNLVKTNLLYKNYSKIYPSPELQLNWLKPKQRQF